jgi:hypothetical protein
MEAPKLGEIYTVCAFCGEALAGTDALILHAASPTRGNQSWGAHQACLVERLSDGVCSLGGQIVDDGLSA